MLKRIGTAALLASVSVSLVAGCGPTDSDCTRGRESRVIIPAPQPGPVPIPNPTYVPAERYTSK